MSKRTFVSFVLIGLCLCIGIRAQAKENKLQLRVKLDKDQYTMNEPINITFILFNPTAKSIYVNKRFYLASNDIPKDKRDVYLEIVGPDGNKLPCKFRYETGFPKTDYFFLLEPQKEVSSEYPRDLRGYYEFNLPGKYKLVAIYENVYGREIGLQTYTEKIVSTPVYFEIKEKQIK